MAIPTGGAHQIFDNPGNPRLSGGAVIEKVEVRDNPFENIGGKDGNHIKFL